MVKLILEFELESQQQERKFTETKRMCTCLKGLKAYRSATFLKLSSRIRNKGNVRAVLRYLRRGAEPPRRFSPHFSIWLADLNTIKYRHASRKSRMKKKWLVMTR